MIRVVMGGREGDRISSPTAEDAKDILGNSENYGGRIGDIAVCAHNGINGSVYRNLELYLKDWDEVMLIYQTKELDDWVVLPNPSIQPGSRFLAEDQGEADWKLSTRHLVLTSTAIQVVTDFTENQGVISDLSTWETFPEDFI